MVAYGFVVLVLGMKDYVQEFEHESDWFSTKLGDDCGCERFDDEALMEKVCANQIEREVSGKGI